jgi:hypothetical protein
MVEAVADTVAFSVTAASPKVAVAADVAVLVERCPMTSVCALSLLALKFWLGPKLATMVYVPTCVPGTPAGNTYVTDAEPLATFALTGEPIVVPPLCTLNAREPSFTTGDV